MRSPLAGLTTRGLCLLAAGVAAAACAVLLDERDLLRIAAFVAALPLLAGLVRMVPQGISARRRMPSRVTAGTSVQVRIGLSAPERARLSGLALAETVPDGFGDSPRLTLPAHPPARGVTVSYSLAPARRGVYRIGPLVGRLTDPFGLVSLRRQLCGVDRLVVHPVVQRLEGLPAGLGARPMVGPRSDHDPDDVAVRAYRQGDDLRKVAWRSTARRDELMVRTDDRYAQVRTNVVLDRRAGPQLERAISLTASVYAHLRAHGQQVRASTVDGSLLADTDGSEGSQQALLDRLAALADTAADLAHPDPAVLDAPHDLVAVLGVPDRAATDKLIRCRRPGTRTAAVLLHAEPGEQARAEGALAAAGWTVAAAGPEEPLAAAWSRLCRSSNERVGIP